MMVDVTTTLPTTPRPVLSSLDELLEGATSREPFGTTDSKSGSAFERVVIGGESLIVKHVHVDDDWTMRFNGDIGCHPAQVWKAGLMDVLPERIDHGVVAVAAGLGRNCWGAAILMRDLSDAMVPPGDDADRHSSSTCSFIDDLAALSARMWGWKDDVGLVPLDTRWTWFNHASLAVEAERGLARSGAEDRVRRLGAVRAACTARRLRHDRRAAARARHRSSPRCARRHSRFVHGDWKLGNLGTAADGRTVLIDWTYPGESPCCYELAWYLAVNRARMPQSKDDAIDTVPVVARAQRHRHRRLVRPAAHACRCSPVCVMFGWEKALGDDDELGWWCDRAREGAARL